MNRANDDKLDRTTCGLELDISLSGVPRGRWGAFLADELRSANIAGRLASELSLPSSRGLAADLGVSRGVVVEAYAQLVAEGHLATSHGSGTRIAPRTASAGQRKPPHIDSPRPPGNPGRPDPALFPRREWNRAVSAALRELPDADLSYGDPRGLAELRTALVDYLARVRSITANPDQVVVVNGFAQGLVCVARHLASVHRRPLVAVEDPGSTGVVEQLRAWEVEVVPIPVDDGGLVVERLVETEAVAVVVTPAHQYPTGVTLGPARRLALLEWARNRDALIVEDEYDAEYRYDRAPLTSLHALDPDRVISAGSTSKCLSPALRLGWLVAPAQLADSLTGIKAMIDLGAPTLPQAALARFIVGGNLDRHIRRTRSIYRRRRDALVAALRQHGHHAEIEGIAAGLHVLLQLEDGVDESGLAARARELGLEAQPLQTYRHRAGPPGLVLGYANRTPDQLRHAVERLLGGHKGDLD